MNLAEGPSPSTLLDWELKVHRDVYTPWTADHVATSDGKIKDAGYDPVKFPSQRLTVFKQPVAMPDRRIPEMLYFLGMRHKLSNIIGRNALLGSFYNPFVESFRNTPAFEGEEMSVAEAVKAYVADGKKIAVLTDHVKYEDLGYVTAGLVTAIGSTAIFGKTGVILNKNMTREEIEGKLMPDRISLFANSYFVSPDTPNAKKYRMPDEIAAYISNNGIFTLVRDLHDGGITAWNLPGSGTKPIKDNDGSIDCYDMPNVAKNAPNLLSRYDYTLVVVTSTDPSSGKMIWHVDNLIPVEKPTGTRAERDQQSALFANKIQQRIANNLERLTNIPVNFDAPVNT